MFTGIIEELCLIKDISRRGNITRIAVDSKLAKDTREGDSVSINGVCLTVVGVADGSFEFEAMPETLKTTNLIRLKKGDRANAELALKIGDRLGGHFVTGHVDCLGTIRRKYYLRDNLCFDIAIPPDLLKYVFKKGSIAVDGISLTVMEKKSGIFSVYIIPHTFKNTTLSFKGPADKVNIELDILAKRQENSS